MQLRGLAGACAVLIAAIAATGCGTTGLPEAGSGDATRARCSSRQTAASATPWPTPALAGVIGPNLDDAFRQSRVDGLGDLTVKSVVRDQIAYPVEHPTTGAPGMPADLVNGEDADSVALYVGTWLGCPCARNPGRRREAQRGGRRGPDGKAIFAEAGCAGCHTLEGAGTSGTVGPNLDDAKPPKELVIDRVTNGRA